MLDFGTATEVAKTQIFPVEFEDFPSMFDFPTRYVLFSDKIHVDCANELDIVDIQRQLWTNKFAVSLQSVLS